jgi:hemerythrin-like domain-containing protein
MQDTSVPHVSRRAFLVKTSLLIAAAGLPGAVGGCASEKASASAPIPATEDLMQEHGVLRRIMLIYDEIGRRLQQGQDFPLPTLSGANAVTSRYIQDFHEKNEELYVFNRFSQAGKMVELVAILYQQHLAGRKLMDKINSMATAENFKNPWAHITIAQSLNTFNQAMRRHAAWEDTVLFPAFRSLLSPKEFVEVGATLHREEEKRFGANAFNKIVGQVADLEKTLGIHDIQQFTPKL